MISFLVSLGFNNREIALLFWFTIIFTWLLTRKSDRKSIYQAIRAFFQTKVFLLALLMLLYIAGLVFLAHSLSVWDLSNLKDTVFWTIGVAFAIFINLGESRKDDFFKQSIKDSVKLVLILEFLVNLYTFKLWIEIIFMPILLTLGGIMGVASTNKKYKDLEKFLSYILGVYGLVVLIFTIYHIITDFSTFATLKNLRVLLLPPVFTFSLLPFLYLVALYIQYESVSMRMGFFIKNPAITSFAKRRVLLAFHFNLRGLNKWSRNLATFNLEDRDAVTQSIMQIKGRQMLAGSHEESDSSEELVTLTEFIEANHRSISVLGLLIALFVFANILVLHPYGNLLSALFLTLVIIVWLDLWGRIPSSSGTGRLFLFKNILSLTIIILVAYWLLDPNSVWNAGLFIIIFAVTSSIFSWLFKRYKLFKRLFKVESRTTKILRYFIDVLLIFVILAVSLYVSTMGSAPLNQFLDSVRAYMIGLSP